MNLKTLGAAALLACFGTLGTAQAASYTGDYVLSFGGTTFAQFSITTDGLANADGFETITDLWGTVGGTSITGLLAPGNTGGNDNLFRLDGTHLTFGGVSFIAGSDGVSLDALNWNLFYSSNSRSYVLSAEDSSFFSRGQLSVSPVSPVPEPESYAMLLAGLGALGFVSMRRQSQRQVHDDGI